MTMRPLTKTLLLSVLLTLTAGPLLAPSASARVGRLKRVKGKRGCLTNRATKHCRHIRFGGGQMWDMAVSPDGRNAYLATISGGLAVFKIRHGTLHQLRGRAGCLSGTGRFHCKRVRELFVAEDVAVSPDGRNVYVAAADRSRGYGGILVFKRYRRSGALRRLTGTAGCLGEKGTRCRPARGVLRRVRNIALSPDGRSVYAASDDMHPFGALRGAIAVFARNRRSGRLSQLPGTEGCLNRDGADGCGMARALLPDCCALAVSPSSGSVYATSDEFMAGTFPTAAKFGVAAFERDLSSGALTQLPGASGCLTQDGFAGCTPTAFRVPASENTYGALAISPDGRYLYAAHESLFPEAQAIPCERYSSFIAVLRVDLSSGAPGELVQDKAACSTGFAMSPDGRSLYTMPGFGGPVELLVRHRRSGRLSRGGCIARRSRRCNAYLTDYPGAMAIAPGGRRAFFAAGYEIQVFKRRADRG